MAPTLLFSSCFAPARFCCVLRIPSFSSMNAQVLQVPSLSLLFPDPHSFLIRCRDTKCPRVPTTSTFYLQPRPFPGLQTVQLYCLLTLPLNMSPGDLIFLPKCGPPSWWQLQTSSCLDLKPWLYPLLFFCQQSSFGSTFKTHSQSDSLSPSIPLPARSEAPCSLTWSDPL